MKRKKKNASKRWLLTCTNQVTDKKIDKHIKLIIIIPLRRINEERSTHKSTVHSEEEHYSVRIAVVPLGCGKFWTFL